MTCTRLQQVMVGQDLQYNVGTVTYISDGGPSSNTSAIVGSTVAVFVVLAVGSALLIVVLVIFWRRSAKAALLANKYEHQEMTERKEGSKDIIVALITLFSSQFFQMWKIMVIADQKRRIT